jgi:hypothetical protein
MKFKRQGDTAMVIAIFIGGMFLGFSLGFATMALLAARGSSFQSEKAQTLKDNLACAYSPIRKFRPVRLARTQAAGVLLTPQS